MERDFEQDNSEFAEEDLTGYQSLRNTFLRLIREVNSDPAALVVLKGHLVVEEKITAAIEKFVFHPEQLERARLSFADKVAIARSISLYGANNSMGDVVLKLNALRNRLAHSLIVRQGLKRCTTLVNVHQRM